MRKCASERERQEDWKQDRERARERKKKQSVSERVKSDGADLAERDQVSAWREGIPFCCSRSLKQGFP